MNSNIVVALITGGASVLAVVITTIAAHIDITQKLDKQQAIFEAIVSERLDTLKKQVEKHNQVIERTFRLEQDVALHSAELSRVDDRLDKIEGRQS